MSENQSSDNIQSISYKTRKSIEENKNYGNIEYQVYNDSQTIQQQAKQNKSEEEEEEEDQEEQKKLYIVKFFIEFPYLYNCMKQERNQQTNCNCIFTIVCIMCGWCQDILNINNNTQQKKKKKSSEYQPLNQYQDNPVIIYKNKQIDFCLPYNGLANHNREYNQKSHILKDIELGYSTSFDYQCQRQVRLYGLMAKNRQSIDNFAKLFGYTLEKVDKQGIQAFIIDDNMFVFYNLNENNDDYNLEHQLKSFLIKTTQTIIILDLFEGDENLLCEFKKLGQIKDKQLVYLHQCQMKDSYFSNEKKIGQNI
ncbi:hypothetical protein PPERSA_04094 [Pseudocohnilembus persalinus]|uniref:Uncharacterized protein n=1 Tax=Pseudocohnilembus persalinus TaxID=266149 RepID=A0A0V0QKV0_PSEPJ|nr:hypothetical protein PPERSA_04094 [Pseudocohnilembus persalinus]|eukprot:KRX02891.1 hypothetical protein PPERSA_04094 [Pseudocohnilembus persalinus]